MVVAAVLVALVIVTAQVVMGTMVMTVTVVVGEVMRCVVRDGGKDAIICGGADYNGVAGGGCRFMGSRRVEMKLKVLINSTVPIKSLF